MPVVDPPELDPKARPYRSWFHGTWGNISAPALWEDPWKWVIGRETDLPRELLERLDGGYAPGSTVIGGKVVKPTDLFQRGHVGLFRYFYCDQKFTVLSAWDRTGVNTVDSCTTFVLEGVHPAQFVWRYVPMVWADVFGRMESVMSVNLEGYVPS